MIRDAEEAMMETPEERDATGEVPSDPRYRTYTEMRKITMGSRNGEMVFKVEPISRDEQLHRTGNFEEDGQLYLVRCYNCDYANGRENRIDHVAKGECAWCGWKEK